MRIGYARLSEEDQTLPLQREVLQAAGCEQVYEERARGQTTRRPQRDACLQALRAGDTLVVRRLNQLGRSLSDLIRLSAELQAAGQEPMRAIAARFGVAPLTLYRNLAEPPLPDAS